MDSNISKMNQILSNLQARYKQMDQLMTLTKEMEKVINSNDLESLGAVLSMRQDCMGRIDKLNFDTDKIVDSMAKPYQDKLKSMLANRGEPLRLDNPLETNIFDTNKRTLLLLQKIIALDEAINKHVQKGRQPE